ncbi:MAG: VOC family protein [Paracoccaceae bacterium]
MQGKLHHVSFITRDLDRALAFYVDRLGFTKMSRPNLSVPGAWVRAGEAELHLILYGPGTLRSDPAIDASDTHFAIRVPDFDAALDGLRRAGFREGTGADTETEMLVKRQSAVGYGQIYIRDPDHNIIEINAPV